MLPARFGPQRRGDSPLLRALRLHQSWYRADVKKLSRWGCTPAPHERELGSILAPQDAQAGHNFESDEAWATYQERRTRGWGIEPIRCLSYMTSSQVLTLNLLGPLLADLNIMERFLKAIGIVSSTARVTRGEIEYAPNRPSAHLNDRTIIDGYVEVRDSRGSSAIAIETKLADSFSARSLGILSRSNYIAANERFLIWGPGSEGWTVEQEQLARVHMLASSVSGSAAKILTIHHPLDSRTPRVSAGYQATLTDPKRAITIPLDDAIEALDQAGISKTTVQRLRLRYLDLTAGLEVPSG